MKAVTYNSIDYYLFWHRADESQRQQLEVYLPSKLHAGASEREARPPLGQTLRVSRYQFTTSLGGMEPRDLDDALKAKTTEKILVPFWPGAMPQSEYVSAPLDGGLNISFDVDDTGWSDFAAYEIHTGRTPISHPVTAATWTAPLLVTRFVKEPQPDLETDELQDLTVSFEQDSAPTYALDLDAQSFTAGPTLESAKYLFPLRHDFSRPAGGGTDIQLNRTTIGQGGESTVEYYGGQAYGTPRQVFMFANLDEACQLLRFFQDHKGITDSFWLPGYVAQARLTSHVASTDTSIEVDSVAPFTGKPYLCLVDRETLTPLEVDSISDPDLNFAAPVGQAYRYDETSLCELLLVRFSKMRLQLSWDGPGGEASIEFKELRPELSAPAGETLGVTLGGTPRTCSLYEFTDGTNFWRLTSFESDLSWNSQNWVAHPITHGPIRSTIALDDQVSIEAAKVAGSPLLGFHNHEIPRLWVTIYRGEASGALASNVSWKFAGEILDCPKRGPLLDARAVLFGAEFDEEARGWFQRPCWYPLYGAGCGLSKSDWIFSAAFSDVGTEGWPYTFELDSFTRDNTDPLPGGFGYLNWLAWGYLEVGGQKLGIQSSTAISSGKITVNLMGDPSPFPSVLDTVKVVPSCDGKWVTCKAYHSSTNPRGKFDNKDNWGGHHVADGNFSLVKVSSTVSGGKK